MGDIIYRKSNERKIYDGPNLEKVFYFACEGFVAGAVLSIGYFIYDNLRPLSGNYQTNEIDTFFNFLAPAIIGTIIGASVGLIKIINEKIH